MAARSGAGPGAWSGADRARTSEYLQGIHYALLEARILSDFVAEDDLAEETADADIAGPGVLDEAEPDTGSSLEAADTPAAPADQEATPDGDAEERAEA